MAHPRRQTFKATLVAMGPGGSWTHLPIPFKVEEVFGTKARVAVRGTINGFAFRSSIMPRGDGSHYMAINRAMQTGAKAAAGAAVAVAMEPDIAERTVTVPPDLRKALGAKGGKLFAALSYSHQKEYVEWIEQAKRPETRAARVQKALTILEERVKPKR